MKKNNYDIKLLIAFLIITLALLTLMLLLGNVWSRNLGQTLPSFTSLNIPEDGKEVFTSKMASVNMPFIKNEGQAEKSVKFYAQIFGGTVFVTGTGEIVYSLTESESVPENDMPDLPGSNAEPIGEKFKITGGLAFKEELIGGAANNIAGEEQTAMKVSYFNGNDESEWENGIAVYNTVNLGEVYEGIIMKLSAYGNNVEKLFFVQPRANPENIRMRLSGADDLFVNENGELVLQTELGPVSFTSPAAYQEKDGKRIDVEINYWVEGYEYGFAPGEYDEGKELIIDPLLASTYAGGNSMDNAMSITADEAGNIYITMGSASSNLPATIGAYDESAKNGLDVFVAKMDGNLSTVIAATYLGGNGDDGSHGISITMASNGDIYLAGNTKSTNFPTTSGAYDTSCSGSDIFVSKLNNNLTGLLASTCIGGNTRSDYNHSMALSADGYVYITGETLAIAFPTTSGAYDETYGGGSTDAFVSKFDSNLSTLIASTYLGGEGNESGNSIIIDSSGYVYIGGGTSSADFPATPGAFDASLNGSADTFISKFDSNLSSLIDSTFLGGTSYDAGTFIALGTGGNLYLGGYTKSPDFPVTSGAFDESWNGGTSDLFVSKLNNNLSTLLASTFLGGSSSYEFYHPNSGGTVAGPGDYVYVTGFTDAADSPSDPSDFPTTPGAFDESYNGNGDAVLSKLDKNLSTLMASTFLGGSGSDQGIFTTPGPDDSIYLLGQTESSNFPTTQGAFDESHNGNRDVFVVKLDSDLTGTLPVIRMAEPDGLEDILISGTNYKITWVDSAPTDSAVISLYYDTDSVGTDGTLIVSGLSEDSDIDYYSWDTSAVPAGNYYIYGILDDGINPQSVDYSSGMLTVFAPEAPIDYGDAPDIFYPTLKSNNGAGHLIDSTVYLGAEIDQETDGQPGSNALGDDNDGNDDEDGVTFTSSLAIGNPAALDVTASTAGKLNAWVDFNADGDWDDEGEQIVMNTSLDAGVNSLTFNTPSDADEGETFARFRFDLNGDLRYYGLALNGEVEDYVVDLKNNTIQIIEPDGIGDLVISGDDYTITWADSDPDTDASVSLYFDTDNAGQNGTLIVSGLSEDSSIDYYSWNTNGIPGGDYYVYGVLDDGINPLTVDYSDGTLTIVSQGTPIDYGDAPDPDYPTLKVNNGAGHVINGTVYLGLGIDAELDGQPGTNALDDDNNGNDDEDGVTFTSALVAGSQASIDVTASTEGFLNGWVDFNTDGDWEDQGENIFAGLNLTAGTNSLTFSVPAGAAAGSTYARFRFTSNTGSATTPVGLASDGEVEDHLVNINYPPAIQIIEPDGTNDTVFKGSTYTITWTDEDLDDDADLSLYYDTNRSGVNGTLIVSGLSENSAVDSYDWDTTGMLIGSYYVYGVIDDGLNPQVVDYSSGAVIIELGPCTEYLCNRGFEDGLDYWDTHGTPNNQISADTVEGNYSLYSEHTRTSSDVPAWSGVIQRMNSVEPAQTYGLGLWVKGQNVERGHVKIKWLNSLDNVIRIDYPITRINGTIGWTSLNRLVTSPLDSVSAELVIIHGINVLSQNVEGSTLWVDDLIFDAATEPCGTLCNASFEHGLLYWNAGGTVGSHTIEKSGAHEGLKVLKSEQLYTSSDSAGWAGITQFARVTETTTYRLRLWLKSLNASTGHVRIRWRDEGGSLLSAVYPITGINGTNSTWFKREATITAPVSAAKAEISILHGVTSGTTNIAGSTIWIDDITMICQSLCNGGFEDGYAHWQTKAPNKGEIITADVQEGTQAMKVVQSIGATDTTQWTGISQRLMVSGGTSYDLSFWLKKENAVQGHVKVIWRDADDQLISQEFPIGGINGTDLTWAQMGTTLTAPANAETAEFFIWHGVNVTNQNSIGSTLYLDNVTFSEVI